MADTYRLLDAEALAAAHPRSFFIPSDAERATLEVGQLVKLIFEDARPDSDGDAERMWVEITDVASGGYVGRLENEPIHLDIDLGARVEFEPRHVIDVLSDEPDPYAGLTLLVSARLLEDDSLEPRFVAFEPDDAGRQTTYGRIASGWELYVGDESSDELDDPDRIRLPALDWILLRYPALQPLVDGHDGTEASWQLADGAYRPIDTPS